MSIYSYYTLYLFAYLLGSIPFGLLFVQWSGRGDVRDIGSGNIGTTNVLRTGSKKLAAATLLADGLKGALPILFAKSLGVGEGALCLVAGMAVIGHVFPLWLSFKGGKGVATALGCYVAIDPLVGLLTLITWGGMAKIFRISSLSALVSLFMSPLYEALFGGSLYVFGLMVGIYGLILWTHRDNIFRIMRGEEKLIKREKG
jgi:glycerol-3-phosphate acyltransferase PlsY